MKTKQSMTEIIITSVKELYNLAPINVVCRVELLERNNYFIYEEVSGQIRRGGHNHILFYPDIEYQEKVGTQIQMSEPTNRNPNSSKKLIFGEICKRIFIKEIKGHNYKNNKSNIKMKITNLAKKILDKNIKKLIEAGYIDNKLELTQEGTSALLAILFQEKKEELVKLAKDEIKENKNKKKLKI